jgi:Na+/proline symporter
MDAFVIGIVLYILIQFGIGVWVSRLVHTESDYLIAGRRLGLVLGSFSIFATWFGAETVIGAAGAIYEEGIAGGSADPFGYVLCIFLMGLLFAAPLWRRGYTTFADLFRDRYSPLVERVAILLLVPPSVIWAAAQIRAFGQVLSSATELDIGWAMTTATMLVIAYTAVGGLLADAWTDLVQGIALIVGLVIIGWSVWSRGEIHFSLAMLPPERLAFGGGPESAWYEISEAWAIPALGSVFAVELISRVLACRSASTARNACLLGGAIYLAVGIIPVMLGLFGPQLHPNLTEPEQLLPILAKKHLGPVFFVMFSGALISAILSTVDSALLSASALLSHNLLMPAFPQLGDRNKVLLSRLSVAVLGLIAYVIAIYSTTIFELVQTASAFGSSGIVVTACFGLGTRFGGPRSAMAALVTGLVVWQLGDMIIHWPAPFLVSLAASALAYVCLALGQPAAGRP